MQTDPKRSNSSSKLNGDFANGFLASFTKLSDVHVKKSELGEVRSYLTSKVESVEHIKICLALLFQHTNHSKLRIRRKAITLIGLITELFKEKLLSFIPNILQVLGQKLREATNELHDVIGDAVENLTRFCIRNIRLSARSSNLQVMLSSFFELCYNENYQTQTGAGLCLSRIIHFSPPDCLTALISDILKRIAVLLRLINFKAHLQLFECLLSFLVVFKGENEMLEENIEESIPSILEGLSHKDSNVRKLALDLISMIHSMVPKVFLPFKDDILRKLNYCRFDEIKSVRDTSFIILSNLQSHAKPPQGDQTPQVPMTQTPSMNQRKSLRPDSATQKIIQPRMSAPSKDRILTHVQSTTARSDLCEDKPLILNVSRNRLSSALKPKPAPVNTSTRASPAFFDSSTAKKIHSTSTENARSKAFKFEKNMLTPSKLRGRYSDYYVQLFGSKDRTFKYVVSDRKYKGFEEGTDIALKAAEFKDDDTSTQMASPARDITPLADQLHFRASIAGTPDTSGPLNLSSPGYSEAPGNIIGIGGYMSGVHEDHIRRDILSILERLDGMNQQQSEILRSLSTFRHGAFDEVISLKKKLHSLENVIQEVQTSKQALHPYLNQFAAAYHSQPDVHTYKNSPSLSYSADTERVPHSNDSQLLHNGKSELPPHSAPLNGQYTLRNSSPSISEPSPLGLSRRATDPRHNGGDQDSSSVSEAVRHLLKDGHIEDAYRVCIEEGSQEDLLKLMKKTGIVIDQIQAPVLEKLLVALKLRVANQENYSLVINWIEEAMMSSIEISRDTLMALHDKLTWGLKNKRELPEEELDRIRGIVGEIENRVDKTIKRKGSEL